MNTFKINPCTKLYSQLAWMGYQTTGLSLGQEDSPYEKSWLVKPGQHWRNSHPQQSSPELGVQPVLQLFRNDVSATRE